MDAIDYVELRDLIRKGLDNHAPWEQVELQVRRLAKRMGQSSLPNRPTDAEIEQLLDRARHKYLAEQRRRGI